MNPPIIPTIPPPMNPMPTTPSFVSLPPEILRMVFMALDPPDRARSCRLNKYLNTVAAPLFWQWVDVFSHKQIRRFCTRDAQQAFTRNSALVRHLYLTRETFSLFLPRKKTSTTRLDRSSSSSSSLAWSWQKTPSDLYLPGVFTNLRYLTLGGIIDNYQSRYTFTQEEGESLVAFLRQNPTLTNVVISQVDMQIDALLRITTQEELFPNLTCLTVDPYLTPWTAKVLLEGLPESVRSVSLQVNMVDGHDGSMSPPSFYSEAVQPRNHPAMEELEIGWRWRRRLGAEGQYDCTIKIVGEHEENVLGRFLETCSRRPLEFSVGYTTALFCNERLRKVLDSLGAECFKVDLSHLPKTKEYSDNDYAAIVMGGSRWVEIGLDGRGAAGPVMAAAIRDRGDCLRQLDIAGCPRISSKDVCAILSRCACLESLTAINWAVPEPARHPHVEGEDLIELEWACRGLKWWACIITVPRPDKAKENHGRHTHGEMAESRRIQRQVYRKLGQLTGLQGLCLGSLGDFSKAVLHRSWVQFQSLEMTLESGLDELSGLKKLLVLDACYLSHRIDVNELRWMEKSWPRIANVDGLFRNCYEPIPAAREWIKMHHLDWISPKEEE